MRGKPRKEDLFKIPNILCYLRILMVPLFVYIFSKGYYWQSALIVILAALTDIADGWIARNFNLITDWGKFIDPLADKLMQFAMLIMALFKSRWVFVLIIVFALKELIMLGVGLYIYHKGSNLNGAIWCGKLCTVVLDISLLTIIALPHKYLSSQLIIMLIIISSAFLLLSFVFYMKSYKDLYRTMKEEGIIQDKHSEKNMNK